jgi:hypothetical protein
MRNRSGMLALVSAVTACGGGSTAVQADGPVTMGVIAGNFQVVPAARDAALPQPVVAQVVRGPNGQVSLRILDALLPEKAYAQTSVVGIPNQVVCASTPDPKHALRAEVACATSDALGRATFVFHSDSVAGTAKGQIAAALVTGTKITDSVSATVMAGVVDSSYRGFSNILQKGDTIPSSIVRDKFGNGLPFAIVSDSLITVASTVTGNPDARRFTFVTPSVAKADRITNIVGSNGATIARMRYTLRIDGTFDVAVAGLNRAP